MNDELKEKLRALIEDRLAPLLEMCHAYHFSSHSDTIELHVTETKDDVSSRILIRLYSPDGWGQVHIPNISLPAKWKGHRRGLRLIRDIFELCDRHRCPLFITHMTPSFYAYLQSIGAVAIDEDTVEVMPETRLT